MPSQIFIVRKVLGHNVFLKIISQSFVVLRGLFRYIWHYLAQLFDIHVFEQFLCNGVCSWIFLQQWELAPLGWCFVISNSNISEGSESFHQEIVIVSYVNHRRNSEVLRKKLLPVLQYNFARVYTCSGATDFSYETHHLGWSNKIHLPEKLLHTIKWTLLQMIPRVNY